MKIPTRRGGYLRDEWHHSILAPRWTMSCWAGPRAVPSLLKRVAGPSWDSEWIYTFLQPSQPLWVSLWVCHIVPPSEALACSIHHSYSGSHLLAAKNSTSRWLPYLNRSVTCVQQAELSAAASTIKSRDERDAAETSEIDSSDFIDVVASALICLPSWVAFEAQLPLP